MPAIGWLMSGLSLAIATPPGRVVVAIPAVAADDTDERVVAAVLAHTRAHGLSIALVRPEQVPGPALLVGEGHALAARWRAQGVLWIDLVPGGASMLYLTEPARSRVYGRRLPVGGGSAQAESVANVVSAVIVAILDGQIAGGAAPAGLAVVDPGLRAETPTSRESPARSGPRAADRASAPTWPRLRLAVGYTGNTFAVEVPWQSGLELAIGWRPTARTLVDLGYAVMPGSRVRTDVVDLAVFRHPVALTAGYTRPLRGRWDLRLALRVAVDVVRRTARAAEPGVAVSSDRAAIFSSVAAMIGIGVRLAAPVRVGVAVGVEATWRRTEYVVHAPERVEVLSPAPVRAVAAMTLEFELVRRPRPPQNI